MRRNDNFKNQLAELFMNQFGPLSNIRYAFLEMDTQKRESRIEYPGYNKSAQAAGDYNPKYIPGFRSCVKALLFINQCNRIGYKRKGRNQWVGDAFRKIAADDENCSYKGDIFLFIANSVLSDDFKNKTDAEKIQELIDYSIYTVKQLDEYGYYPISAEVIPEINGCLPEQVYPHSEIRLNKILKKIKLHGLPGYVIRMETEQ